MDQLVSFIAFILSLGLLVFIHELGHFAMAKLYGVYVKEFSIGFGPTIIKFKRGETQYSLRLFPFGGYVAMHGEEASSSDKEIPFSRSLLGISKPKRAVVMSAGIILNLLLAFILFFVANIGFTQRQVTNQLTIQENSIAFTSGIQTNEILDFELLESNEIDAITNEDITYNIHYQGFTSFDNSLLDIIEFRRIELGVTEVYQPNSLDDTITFSLPILTRIENSESFLEREVALTLSTIEVDSQFTLLDPGIEFFVKETNYNLPEALTKTTQDWWGGVTLISQTIIGLFSGQNYDQVGGIVAIYSTTSSVLSNLGLGFYIYIWALISVNLAIFNLLPFPGLDGWHLMIISIEGLSKKEIPPTVKNTISMIGFIILMGLMILLLFRDLISLGS
jgi:regulator of sigma E protease